MSAAAGREVFEFSAWPSADCCRSMVAPCTKVFFVNSAQVKQILSFRSQFNNMSEKESILLLNTGLDKKRAKLPGVSIYGPLVFLVLEFLCLLKEGTIAHCTENPIHVFPEIKLSSLVPNSYIHVSVSDYIFPLSQDRSPHLAEA